MRGAFCLVKSPLGIPLLFPLTDKKVGDGYSKHAVSKVTYTNGAGGLTCAPASVGL